jgi:putative tricarboxylic transport membrane protein
MSHDQNTASADKPLVSTRVMEVATGLVIIALGALVIFDTQRLGAGWGEMGPEPGYFPFWIGVLLTFAGVMNVMAAFLPGNKASGDVPFVTRQRFKSVLQVYIPTVLYVVAMQYIGLYVAAALYIIGFMMLNGKYPIIKTLPYAIGVPIFLFLMFEVWFLIALPKGPIEAMLGF